MFYSTYLSKQCFLLCFIMTALRILEVLYIIQKHIYVLCICRELYIPYIVKDTCVQAYEITMPIRHKSYKVTLYPTHPTFSLSLSSIWQFESSDQQGLRYNAGNNKNQCSSAYQPRNVSTLSVRVCNISYILCCNLKRFKNCTLSKKTKGF